MELFYRLLVLITTLTAGLFIGFFSLIRFAESDYDAGLFSFISTYCFLGISTFQVIRIFKKEHALNGKITAIAIVTLLVVLLLLFVLLLKLG